jgi:predicted nucleotidyltransferase component of viral defense system
MTERKVTNLAASVRHRLLNRARAEGRIFQELATLYAMERFLFRLANSQHVDRFVLKGGLMTLIWAGEYGRVTRDIDLLGWGQNSVSAVSERVRDVLEVETQDGVLFDAQSIQAAEIRVETAYVGVRVSFVADLAGMKLRMQVDVGFGDAVVPEPEWFDYPQLLDLGAPRLLGYPAEATLAEKLHAVVTLGLTNSRMKDYYDLWSAHRLSVVTEEALGRAIRHTFSRRGTPLPSVQPIGLTSAFANDRSKQAQWKGFLRKSGLKTPSLLEALEAAAKLADSGFRTARLD